MQKRLKKGGGMYLSHGLVEKRSLPELVIGDAGQLDAKGRELRGPFGPHVDLSLVDDLLIDEVDDDPRKLYDFLVLARDLGLFAFIASGLEIDDDQIVVFVLAQHRHLLLMPYHHILVLHASPPDVAYPQCHGLDGYLIFK